MVECITIVGLGLIGGSIAKALKERCNVKKIIGIDFNESSLQQALDENIISVAATDIIPEIQESDIVFICTPVGKTVEWIEKILPHIKPNCILTDTGSTKSQLMAKIEQIPSTFRFVGGHPMAGSEKSGYIASRSHLFENAYYVLAPCSKTEDQDIALLTDIVRSFGSIPVQLAPQIHDEVTGAISHVPHVIASALVNMVEKSDTPEGYMQKIAAGGFKDITRIASSNPEMWHNISFSNNDAILKVLDNYIEILNNFKNAITHNDDDYVFNFFSKAKIYRDNMASKVTGLIPKSFELIIDVKDTPGIIGEVATILGENHINIKNINVSNSREYEGGVLILSLTDAESLDNAYQILNEYDYTIVERD